MRINATMGCVCLLLAMPACTAPLPKYPWRGMDTAKATMRQRAAEVHTVQSQGTVLLRRNDGDRVMLDAALLAEMPDRMRLRGWKFGRAVMDLTCRDDAA